MVRTGSPLEVLDLALDHPCACLRIIPGRSRILPSFLKAISGRRGSIPVWVFKKSWESRATFLRDLFGASTNRVSKKKSVFFALFWASWLESPCGGGSCARSGSVLPRSVPWFLPGPGCSGFPCAHSPGLSPRCGPLLCFQICTLFSETRLVDAPDRSRKATPNFS